MIDLQSKIETCFVEKIKYLQNTNEINAIWQQWALYNLFYKIKSINPKLFDNNKPHSLNGNLTWNQTFKIFMKLKKFNLDWGNIAHKEIYLKLKEINSTKIEILSQKNRTITWKIIALQGENLKHLFTNEEKEMNYRIATNAFKWHFKTSKKSINNCKFCHKPIDNIEHVLLNCQPIRKIWTEFENLLNINSVARIALNKDMNLYNLFGKNQPNLTKILEGTIFIKTNIIKKREKLEKKNKYINDNEKFRKKLLQIINTRYKNFSLDIKDEN